MLFLQVCAHTYVACDYRKVTAVVFHLLLLKTYLFVCLCTCVCPWSPEGTLETSPGITGVSEPPDVGVIRVNGDKLMSRRGRAVSSLQPVLCLSQATFSGFIVLNKFSSA